MYFKLKDGCGSHAETGADGRLIVYKAGDVIESDNDLAKMFPNKFIRMGDLVVNPAPVKTDVQRAAEEGFKDVMPPPEEPLEEPLEEDGNPLGRDVTKRFPLAEEEDFLVFARGGAFSVVEADDPTTLLHEKPLKRKDVVDFIEMYLET